MQNRAIIDQTRPDQTRPDQTRPDQTRPDQNYGLSLLKICMSFEVVLCHFWNSDSTQSLLFFPFKKLRAFAVPVFMFAAFFLAGKYIVGRNRQKISARLIRLSAMQVSWAAIYTVFFILSAVFMSRGAFSGKSPFQIFMMFSGQVLLGHTLNPPMWFQADLIYITVIFALIYSHFTDKAAVMITCLCGIAAFAVQYSGLNFMMFGDLHFYVKYTPGRFCEMIPSACAGILCAKYGLTEKLQSQRKYVILSCIAVLAAALLLRRVTGSLTPEGFGYAGIYLSVYAISLTIIFMALPFKNIPAPLLNIIGRLSRFTPGVYCMHMLTAACIRSFLGYEFGSFSGCIVIYAVCMAVSFSLSLVLGKWSRYLAG